jgi:pectate lyase
MQGKYLITTDYYFFGPDGKRYRASWGECEVLEDTFLGVKTNRNATNWYLKVGSDDKHVIIAGCQIHFAIRCDSKPECVNIDEWQ